MTSQWELLEFITKKKVTNYREIMLEFNMHYVGVLRKIKQLNKFGIVEIEVDNQRHVIRLPEQTEEGDTKCQNQKKMKGK